MKNTIMTSDKALALIAQAVINIDEGYDRIAKDSPIYEAMKFLVSLDIG
jgi:hypothetical protein